MPRHGAVPPILVSMSGYDNRLRQLDVLALLLSRRGGVPHNDVYSFVKEYAGKEAEGASRDSLETLYRRDRQALKAAGVRIVEAGDGLRADPSALYDASGEPEFTQDELEVLAIAGDAGFGSVDIDSAAVAGHRKIAAHHPRSTPRATEPLSVSADGIRLSAGEIADLISALRDGTAVRFWYSATVGTDDELREMEPWAIALHRSRLYLVGHDRDRGAPRVFRLANVTDLEPRIVAADGESVASLAREPRPPAAEIEALVVAVHEMGEGYHDVVVHVDPGTCGDVTRRAEDLGGGRWLLRSAGAHNARKMALEHAGHLAVLEPAWLRDEVVAVLREAAAMDGGMDDGTNGGTDEGKDDDAR